MPEPRFLQIHFLASYPGALLNRDDVGLAKRLPFGGATRTRVSSQCLKRHWRMADSIGHSHALQNIFGLSRNDFGIRSRAIFEQMARGLVEEGFAQSDAIETVHLLIQRVFEPKNEKKPSKDGGSFEHLRFDQAFLLGRQEIDYLTSICRQALSGDGTIKTMLVEKRKNKSAALTALQKEIAANLDKNLKLLREQASVPQSIESALFGRMVTSDLLANWDASIHVAHAFTVHDEEPEQDYFTVVDDLTGRSEVNEEGGTGAAGVFDAELTSGLYYGYVVVDVPLLVSNLTGTRRAEWSAAGTERDLAARVVENLVHLIATISPGAKKGSTAPYAWAEAVLVEAGDRQPRTLANAFRHPVALRGTGTLAARTAEAMQCELGELDAMYGPGEARWLAAHGDLAFEGPERMTLPDLAERAGAAVRDAAV